MKVKPKFLILCSLILIFISSISLFCQEPEKSKVTEIKSRLKSTPRWVAYKAFTQADISICESAKGQTAIQDCLEIVNVFTAIKLTAEGKCNSLPYSHREFTDVCQAVNQANCFSLSGYRRTMCEALLGKDVNRLIKAFSDPQYPEYVTNKKDDAEELINIYYGFKNNSESACDRFTTKNLLMKASCNMLFGNQNFEKNLDEISQDIIYAINAKKSGSTQPCTNIKNKSIKDACYDDAVRDLDGILNAIWH